MRARRVRRAVAAAALVLALGGCSVSVGGDTLDSAGLEEEIRKEIAKEVDGEIRVSCPRDVKIKEGHTFQCRAGFDDGSESQVQVTQTDGDGNVRFEVL